MMNVQALLDITGGRLLTPSSVSEFRAVCFESCKIHRGDLLISDELEEIQDALVRGAYGIMTTLSLSVDDREIAWIHVGLLSKALIRIMRFIVLQKSIQTYLFSRTMFDIAKQAIQESSVLFQRDSVTALCDMLFSCHDVSVLLLYDHKIAQDIAPNYRIWQTSHACLVTPLRLRFPHPCLSAPEKEVDLPTLFVHEFEAVQRFCQCYTFSFHALMIHYTSTFYPVFVNCNFDAVAHGRSDQVIVLSEWTDDFGLIVKGMMQHASWAKLLFLCHVSCKTECADIPFVASFTTQDDLFSVLRNAPFTFAIVFGKSLLKSIQFQTSRDLETSLF
jgi:hypothetical protein